MMWFQLKEPLFCGPYPKVVNCLTPNVCSNFVINLLIKCPPRSVRIKHRALYCANRFRATARATVDFCKSSMSTAIHNLEQLSCIVGICVLTLGVVASLSTVSKDTQSNISRGVWGHEYGVGLVYFRGSFVIRECGCLHHYVGPDTCTVLECYFTF